jgi:hypothetical protein
MARPTAPIPPSRHGSRRSRARTIRGTGRRSDRRRNAARRRDPDCAAALPRIGFARARHGSGARVNCQTMCTRPRGASSLTGPATQVRGGPSAVITEKGWPKCRRRCFVNLRCVIATSTAESPRLRVVISQPRYDLATRAFCQRCPTGRRHGRLGPGRVVIILKGESRHRFGTRSDCRKASDDCGYLFVVRMRA